MRLILLIALTAVFLYAEKDKDMSLTTETVVTSNGVQRTIVFRQAGDMVSTNKVKGSDLKNDDKIKKVKDDLKIKDK